MNSDGFFGFETSLQPEDDDDGEIVEEYDDEYDALNDETFGSAAINDDDDWEESHTQLSSLKEAERSNKNKKDNLICNDLLLNDLKNDNDLQKMFKNFSIEKDAKNRQLFDSSKDGLIGSPGNSIWSVTKGYDLSRPFNNQNTDGSQNSYFNNFKTTSQQLHFGNDVNKLKIGSLPSSLSGFPKGISSISGLPKTGIKTVEELERELKQEQPNQQPKLALLQGITAEALEKEITKVGSWSQLQNACAGPPNSYVGHPPLMMPLLKDLQTLLPHLRPPFHFMPPPQIAPTSRLPQPPHLTNRMPLNFPRGFPLGGRPPLLNQPHGPGPFNQAHGPGPFNQAHRPGPFNYPVPSLNQMPLGFNHENDSQIRNHTNDQARRHFESHFHKYGDQMEDRYQSEGGSGRVRRDSDAEWEEWQRMRQNDPYSGLMTPREKNWLRNIQSMLLQTDNAYQDDYYCVMLSVKQQRKREEEVIEIDGLQLLLPDKGKEEKEYEPPRLENSLGKLQVASINAPRKIIDLQVIHLDPAQPTTLMQRDMRKHRHLLMHIEKMYNIQIELNDLQRKIRALTDCPTRDSFTSKCRQLITKLWNSLSTPHESFVQILCIKKGKTLAAWLMNWISEENVEHMLATVIQNLSLLGKKDVTDKILPLMWPVMDRFLASLNGTSLISFAIMMEPQLKAQKNNLIPVLESKLGLSILLAMLNRGEHIWPSLSDDTAWLHFLSNVVTTFGANLGETTLQPLPSVSLAASPRNLVAQLSRCTDIEESSLQPAVELFKKLEEDLVDSASHKSFPSNSQMQGSSPSHQLPGSSHMLGSAPIHQFPGSPPMQVSASSHQFPGSPQMQVSAPSYQFPCSL